MQALYKSTAIKSLLAILLSIATVASYCSTATAQNELRIRDLCRLKGQETNTLQGVGLVVGLKGTGDGDSKPMARALGRMMSLMGAPISADVQGQLQSAEVESAKNVAMVFVTVTIPATGAQPGDQIDCNISAIKAKSLEGGRLLLTPLLGPRSDTPTVYAMANGPIVLEDPKVPTTAKIAGGCKMETALQTNFVADNKFTLILDAEHSSFSTAQYIEDRINIEYRSELGSSGSVATSEMPALAMDPMHVKVQIPDIYLQRPIQYISLILDLPVVNLRGSKRVVIREREGIIIIGEDVTISPVAISHKNLTVSTTAPSGASFVGTTTVGALDQQPTLDSLVKALNQLQVPTSDVIAIIKALKSQGNLYGDLVLE